MARLEYLTELRQDAGYALRMLRTAGLVQNRKDGRVVFYRLADDKQISAGVVGDELRRPDSAEIIIS